MTSPQSRWNKRNPQTNRDSSARVRMRNLSFIATMKMASGCIDCGYNEDPVALDFDHVNGIKYKAISQMKNSSLETLSDEMDKCVVRCANCHRIKTFGEGMYGSTKRAAEAEGS